METLAAHDSGIAEAILGPNTVRRGEEPIAVPRLITIGHSYVVAVNRRLADEMAAAREDWEITAVAPERYPGDLREIAFERADDERCRTLVVPVHLARKPQLMNYDRSLRSVLRDKWDVIHCWEEPYVLSAFQIARWASPNAKLVFSSFQNIQKHYPPPFGWMERKTMRRADGWIAFGRTVEDVLNKRPEYSSREHALIPPGVDLTRFRKDAAEGVRIREQLGWTDSALPVVGYLGRFVKEKGLDVLMRAWERAEPSRMLLVGGGSMEADLRQWAQGFGDRVRIVTDVGHDEVPAFINAMDMLCAPSLTTPRWREQFGRMLIEAMACGVAVIGSDSGEIPHVLGDAGIVVREGDVDSLVAAMNSLICDAALRSTIGMRGLQRAHAEFALPSIAARHLQFFDQVLTSQHNHRG